MTSSPRRKEKWKRNKCKRDEEGDGRAKRGSLCVGMKNRQNNLRRNFVTCITKCYFPFYLCKHFKFLYKTSIQQQWELWYPRTTKMLTEFRAHATPIRTYWQNDSKVISWLSLLLNRNSHLSLLASIVRLPGGISMKRVSEDVGRRRRVGKVQKGNEKRGKKSTSTYPLALTRLFLVCHTN